MAQPSRSISSRRSNHSAHSSSSVPTTPPTHTHENVPLGYQWHDKHELMMRELEEARARATQMEKTMRWWSDCTANWREKWSKVRSERNKAREEVRLLRSRLESVQREAGTLRREKNELEIRMNQSPRLGKEIEKSLFSHQTESPERDGSSITNLTDQCKQHHSRLDGSESLSFLEEMFGCDTKGVENVSVYSHGNKKKGRDESSSLNESISNPLTDIYLRESAEKELIEGLAALSPLHTLSNDGNLSCMNHSIRENDIEENLQQSRSQLSSQHTQLNNMQQSESNLQCATSISNHNYNMGNQNGNNSNHSTGSNHSIPPISNSVPPSPSHRISAMSDPLPETCHVSPRVSAISDPLSELCLSECSETGYAESIRSSDGGRRYRGLSGALSGGLSGIGSSVLDDSGITPEQESLEQQVAMLKLRLEEAAKTIQAERDEKLLLDRETTRWQDEASELRSRLEDVKISRQEAVKELVALRALHQKEVQTLQLEMLDEASSRECIDRRLADLRCELERLQEENAAEWGRRERLESEKLGLERENKKVKSQIADMEDRLDKRNKMAAATPDAEVMALKEDIQNKNKELSDLKHAHNKLKKVLSEKSVELQHCNRRADQYETEVKRLRSRVDELKKELASSQDEVDCASNNIRKLQRSNDEFQETVETLQVQVEHLQSRLRSSQSAALPLRSALISDSDDDR